MTLSNAEESIKKKTDVSDRKSKDERHSMRLYKEDYGLLVYWAAHFDMDRTEFLLYTMKYFIDHHHKNYDLPTAEIQRFNQMIDVVNSLVETQSRLTSTVTSGFDSMLGIIRGDNYLVDNEDGSL